MANCTDDNAQYGSIAECEDYCNNASGWEPGLDSDTGGNTIGCRTYHGGAPAAGDPITHCPHAGPTGANTCGTWCEVYCGLWENNCAGQPGDYNNTNECLATCAGFDDSGNPGDAQYDTVQCRIYHAGTPAAADPGTHCAHAREEPSSECVGLPTDYNFRDDPPTAYDQVDRVGMPAVSTALITSKAAYNADSPANDATYAGEIVASIAALHTALDDDITGATLTPCDTDGLDGDDCHEQEVAPGVPVAALVIPDTLTLNGGATATFPNGRYLADQAMDITLAVILLDLTQHPADTLAGLPLNPPENDLGVEGAFLSGFPYLHPAHLP